LLALIVLYLLVLFAVALVCHGELALSRPETGRLTEFYLWISFGGVLGGIFNALVAPKVFTTAVEFPLVLIIAALLRPPIDVKTETPAKTAKMKRNDLLLPVALGLCMVAGITTLAHYGLRASHSLEILFFGYSMVWCMSFGKRPVRFAAGLAAMLLASSLYTPTFGQILHTERNFFGVLRVTNSPNGKLRYLIHGGTSMECRVLTQRRAVNLFRTMPSRARLGASFGHCRLRRSMPAMGMFVSQSGRSSAWGRVRWPVINSPAIPLPIMRLILR
jgi:hypothetical protein